MFLSVSRAIHSQTSQTQEEADYEVITAYVMDDVNSVQDHELHSGPPSIKVSHVGWNFGYRAHSTCIYKLKLECLNGSVHNFEVHLFAEWQ